MTRDSCPLRRPALVACAWILCLGGFSGCSCNKEPEFEDPEKYFKILHEVDPSVEARRQAATKVRALATTDPDKGDFGQRRAAVIALLLVVVEHDPDQEVRLRASDSLFRLGQHSEKVYAKLGDLLKKERDPVVRFSIERMLESHARRYSIPITPKTQRAPQEVTPQPESPDQ